MNVFKYIFYPDEHDYVVHKRVLKGKPFWLFFLITLVRYTVCISYIVFLIAFCAVVVGGPFMYAAKTNDPRLLWYYPVLIFVIIIFITRSKYKDYN